MSQDTVYISAAETGLVKWSEFRKPPYSAQDYLDAYNNGVNMTEAINTANANGATKVVLERGNYPVCYSLKSAYNTHIDRPFSIKNTKNLEVDGGGACVFAIYDSINKSPYMTDAASNLPAHQLSGCIFGLSGNTNLYIHNFELRGDQYNRAWVSGEQNEEQTYGILLGADNINTTIDITAHGFRGDGISGGGQTDNLFMLTDKWEKGGVQRSDGSLNTDAMCYRTPRLKLSDKDIKRNAVQLGTTGYLRAIPFYNDKLEVFFYDASNKLLYKEYFYQADFVYLAKGTDNIIIVAYDDPRTEPFADYGEIIVLKTGMSSHCNIRGEYYANHRGGISNLCNDTIIEAYIHDNGTTKYGFPHYSDPTRYAINFEDIYVNKLTVKNSRMQNGVSGVLCYSKELVVRDNIIENLQFSPVSCFGTKSVLVSGNTIQSTGSVLAISNNNSPRNKRNIIFESNNCTDCTFYGDFSGDNDIQLKVTDNIFRKAGFELEGNGKNINFSYNTIYNANKDLLRGGILLGNLGRCDGNSVIDALSKSPKIYNVSATCSSNNLLDIKNPIVSIMYKGKVNGAVYNLSDTNYLYTGTISSTEVKEERSYTVSDCDFRFHSKGGFLRTGLQIGSLLSNNPLHDSIVHFKNSKFSKQDTTETNDLFFFLGLNYGEPTAGSSKHKIIFTDCDFDFSSKNTYLLRKAAADYVVDVEFINCTFRSDAYIEVFKPVGTYSLQLANMTMTAKNCKFVNIKTPMF